MIIRALFSELVDLKLASFFAKCWWEIVGLPAFTRKIGLILEKYSRVAEKAWTTRIVLEVKIGVKHFTHPANPEHTNLSTFWKWRPPSNSAVSMRICVRTIWNSWFGNLFLKINPQTPITPQTPIFTVSLTSAQITVIVPDLGPMLCFLSWGVVRVAEVKPELLVGTFQCNECMREVSGVEQQFKIA